MASLLFFQIFSSIKNLLFIEINLFSIAIALFGSNSSPSFVLWSKFLIKILEFSFSGDSMKSD